MTQSNIQKDADQSSTSFTVSSPNVELPKGGGAIRGIGEKFAANPVTGTGSMSVPIATSPGRSGFGPQLSLSYDSGAGNGPFGIGWNLSLPSITRKTDKGLPQYFDSEASDEFILSGAEDLVSCLKKEAGQWLPETIPPRTVNGINYHIQRYRPRIEGLFARIEKWNNLNDSSDVFWRSISKDNITTWYGKNAESRIVNPADPEKIFSWLICESYDDKGNVITYEYAHEDSLNLELNSVYEQNRPDNNRNAHTYLKRINYGNRSPYHPQLRDDQTWPSVPGEDQWLFEVVFDYAENYYQLLNPNHSHDEHLRVKASSALVEGSWSPRPDSFSSYRPGFELRTYRRCQRVLMFHHFAELGNEPCLVGSTEFDYKDLDYSNPVSLEDERNHIGSTRFLSSIVAVTQSGYVRDEAIPVEDINGINYVTYIKKSMPPLTFEYSRATIQQELKEIDRESLENIPQGLDGAQYQWADLDGEGAGGILTEQQGTWFYKRNLSPLNITNDQGQYQTNARFGPAEIISPIPSLSSISSGAQQILDLAADGQVDVVTLDGPVPGLFERTTNGNWQNFKPFKAMPNLNWKDPNLKFVDLTGDGHTDIFITEDEAYCWYQSLGETGFSSASKVRKTLNEEQGPRLVFADGSDSIYLSDFSGDGLSDLVRIRNGEVCYWPNLGYGRFGRKVTMDKSPQFDNPDQFEQKRIRLADIDGTGVTDILYLKHDVVQIYFNQSGNGWTSAYALQHLPSIDNTSSVLAVDLLGNGTACLVWSSPLSGNVQSPIRYVDLMGGQKPHLLIKTVNNLGAETHVHYAPSTHFYLKDKQQGKEWITRLHFPVHVVERSETYDHISHSRFVSHYAYHHGYFDGHEREFRGFGMVEQWDTEEYSSLSQSHVFPSGDNVDIQTHVPPVHTKTWYHTGAYLGRHHISDYFSGLLDQNDKGEYFREPGLDDDQARTMLLPDTILPDDLSIDEEREACRALKGQMIRQEVYADDGTDKQKIPYTVIEQNFNIRRLQAKADNPHAVFLTYARESINYHYERNWADPRIQHALTLEVDDYGNVHKSIAIGYGRRQFIRQVADDGVVTEIPNPALNELISEDQSKQTQTLISYAENEITNAINLNSGDAGYEPLIHNDYYRTPLPAEVRNYELTGIVPGGNAQRFSFDELIENNFNKIINLTEVPYEHEVDYSVPRKRLIEHLRTYYRPNDCGIAQNDSLTLLDSGQLESKALPGESYKLAYTPGLASQIYLDSGKLTQVELQTILTDEGKYVHSEGDNNWWIPSGRLFYSTGTNDSAATELTEAQSHFYLPGRSRNPFHTLQNNTESIVRYDNYDLLMQESMDALNNRVTVGERNLDNSLGFNGNNYRVLQAETMMGPNRNRTRVAFDVLGLVAGSAIMGKPEDNPQQGDVIDNTFIANLTRHQINTFEDDPLGQSAYDLLGTTSSRIINDVHRFYHSQQQYPNEPSKWQASFASTIVRETHVSDLPVSGEFKIQVAFSYSDGFGREIQKKIQAEQGPVEGLGNNINSRWVGSGWTIFNNKGKPVRQYEAYFSTLPDHRHRFEFARTEGVSPILFYDPLQRVVATIDPNHSYEKVVFDPWKQTTYDVNDTVSFDPAHDYDIKRFLINDDGSPRLPDGDYLPTWHQLRTDPAHAAEFEVQHPDADHRQRQTEAALKSVNHADTPTIAHFDSLGRPFLTIVHNKVACANHALDGTEEHYYTRIELDIEGNQREVVDAKSRIVMRYDYYMAGPQETEDGSTPNRIHQSSMEAGERWLLNDVTGNPVRTWDSRGHQFRTFYDSLRRPMEQYVTGENSNLPDQRLRNKTVLFERFEYGEGLADDIALNLRTRVFRQFDGAGVITNGAYDFKGNPLRGNRQLCTDYKEVPDWSQNPAREPENFTSSTSYDALNRPISLTSSDNSITRPTYNEANLLNSIDVNLRGERKQGSLKWTPFVTNIDYDAKGQRELIEYGNGVFTYYEYDPTTFRLVHLLTKRKTVYFPNDCPQPALDGWPGCQVQNLYYTYDPVGNITHIRDDAQQTIYFKNKRIEPSNDYIYDAIYRLIDAAGREHLGQIGDTPIPHSYNDSSRTGIENPGPAGRFNPGDGNAMGAYREQYVYDQLGNFLEMVHHRTDLARPGWTRAYTYNETSLLEPGKQSNRLSRTVINPDSTNHQTEDYAYDSHGNMLSMPQLQDMQWDFKDQLIMSRRQAVNNADIEGQQHKGERTYYMYDASGQRVRKVTERKNNKRINERIYLGGFEVYRQYSGANTGLVRESLHIMDDKQRIALVETRTEGNDSSPEQLIRYQFSNHLGSASLELDNQAELISYEEFTPYGSTSYQAMHKKLRATAKRYRYTGKEKDEESGLYYYGARYYAAWLGRWTVTDPAGFVDGVNLYEYVSNNPLRFIDPNGQQEVEKQPPIGESVTSGYNYFLYKDTSEFKSFEKKVGHLKDPTPPPMTAKEKTYNTDVLTKEHDEAVKKVINTALEISSKKFTDPHTGEMTATKKKIIDFALRKLLVPLRERSLADVNNLIFRDADHYFAGLRQEWQTNVAILKYIGISDVRANEMRDAEGKPSRIYAHLSGIITLGYDYAKRERFRKGEGTQSELDFSELPASAPGGGGWAALGTEQFFKEESTFYDKSLPDLVDVTPYDIWVDFTSRLWDEPIYPMDGSLMMMNRPGLY